jgi:hypothetical protein
MIDWVVHITAAISYTAADYLPTQTFIDVIEMPAVCSIFVFVTRLVCDCIESGIILRAYLHTEARVVELANCVTHGALLYVFNSARAYHIQEVAIRLVGHIELGVS